MARKTIRQDDSYRIEFETQGNGTYWLIPKNENARGPYADEAAAMRAAVAMLEARLGKAGADLEESIREDEEATQRAIAEAERREREEKYRVATTDPKEQDAVLFRPQIPAPAYTPRPNRASEGADAPVRPLRPRVEE
jgi:Arc/MetJ-type ribon-helix-helix transcriptional regulator